MSNTPTSSSSARRTYMQKPTPVGRSGYVGHRGFRERARATGSGSAPTGHGLFSQKRGNEQISALFENGVMVPMRGSVAAQCMIASSQPGVTIVSELSSTTSARDSCMPAVGGAGEAQVRLVAQQHDLRVRAPLELARSTRRCADPATRRRSAPAARPDASARARSRRSAHVVRRVVHRHDDVDRRSAAARSCLGLLHRPGLTRPSPAATSAARAATATRTTSERSAGTR